MDESEIDQTVSEMMLASLDFEYFAQNVVPQKIFGDTGYILKDFHEEWLDMTEDAYQSDRVEKLAITAFTGSSKCVVEGSRIPLADGSWKNVENIKSGDEILSTNNDLDMTPEKVAFKYDNGVQPVYKVKTRNGRSIEVTSNHPFLTPSGWRTVDDGLSEGEFLAQADHLVPNGPGNMSDNEAAILGFFTAEGSNASGNGVYISNGNKELLKKFEKVLETRFNKSLKKSSEYVYNVDGVHSSGKLNVREFLEDHGVYGKLSKEKEIPDEVFNAGESAKREFISWLWAGDGTISKDHHNYNISLTSASRKLVYQLQDLLLSLGIRSRINYRESSYCGDRVFDAWELSIENFDSVERFYKLIDPKVSYKKERLEDIYEFNKDKTRNANTEIVPVDPEVMKYCIEGYGSSQSKLAEQIGVSDGLLSMYKSGDRKPSKKVFKRLAEELDCSVMKQFVSDDFRWDEIISVEYVGEKQTYDITVPRTHNFVANGFVVHNTMTLGVLYPMWKAITDPGFKGLITANNMNHSKDILAEIKGLVEDSEYLDSYYDPSEYKWSATRLEFTNGSEIEVRAIYEGVKGAHVDYLFSDEAAEYKEKELFSRYLETRVRRRNGVIVLASTPVHENDLMQWVTEGVDDDDPDRSKRGYKYGTYPIEIPCSEDHSDAFENEDGKVVRPAFPEAFDEEDIRTLRKNNPVTFQKEYLCEPLAVEGDLFSPNNVIDCFDESLEFNKDIDDESSYILACDFAISAKGDYSVFSVFEQNPDRDGVLLKYMERMRGVTLTEQEQKIKDLHKVFNFDKVVIDSTNFGGSVYENLRSSGLPVIGQDFSYKSRSNLLMNLKSDVEDGRLIIPRGETGSYTRRLTDVFYNELLGFGPTETQSGQISYHTTASHDDTVMSIAMGMDNIQEKKSVTGYVAI